MDSFVVWLTSFFKSSEFKSIVVAIVGGILVLLIEYFVVAPLRDKRLGKGETYGKKLKRLVEDLMETSRELDGILIEITETARDREATVAKLEAEIKNLELSEKEYKERIDTLKNIPIPAIDHLLRQMEPSEKKNIFRDYLLFVAGVVASTIISIVLSQLGLGN